MMAHLLLHRGGQKAIKCMGPGRSRPALGALVAAILLAVAACASSSKDQTALTVLLRRRGGAARDLTPVQRRPLPPTPPQQRVPKGQKGAVQDEAPPPGTSTAAATFFNLAKNMIGGGMLALAAGLAAGGGTGYIPAYALLTFSAISSAYTFILVGRAVEATKARSFKEAWSRTIGPDSAWVVDYTITALAFGVCIVYACFLGDTFTSLLQGAGVPPALASRQASIIGVTAALLFPLTLLKDLSALQYSSYAGILAVLYTIVFMALRYFDHSYSPGGRFFKDTPLDARPQPITLSPWLVTAGTFILFNMFSTSFMAHTNAVKFYNELKGRDIKRFTTVVVGAMGAAAVIYAIAMTLGFETFGLASKGLVLSNYHVSKDLLATLARVATAVSIIGAHPLLFTGLRDSFLNTLPPSVSTHRSAWLATTVLLLSAATAIALFATDVGLLVSLVGASLGAAIVYIFPPMMYLHLLRRRKDIERSKLEASLLHLTILFGVVSGVLGTYVTLKGALGG